MFAQPCRGLEAHVALGAGVEFLPRTGWQRRGGVTFSTPFPWAASVQNNHVGMDDHGLGGCHLGVVPAQAFVLLMDEAVPGKTGTVVELLPTDVARVDPPLPMQTQVTPQHPAKGKNTFTNNIPITLVHNCYHGDT